MNMQISTIAELREAMNARKTHGFVNRKKYSNRSRMCWSKHLHDSILESDHCNSLYAMLQSHQIADYKIQHEIRIVVNGKKICSHYVDFIVTHLDGHQEFHETKGFDTRDWQLKRKLAVALNPDIPYVVMREKPKCPPRFWRRKRG